MAAPNSRQTLIEYSLRQLGAPVVDINVDWQQCEDRLDDALSGLGENFGMKPELIGWVLAYVDDLFDGYLERC